MKQLPSGTFDDFIRSLQKEVGGAQRAVKEKQERLVKRYFDVEPDGQLKAVTWTVVVPAGTLRGNGLEETIELPLLSLMSPVQQKIVEVSLEFEAEVEESRRDDGQNGKGNLVLVINKRSKRQKTGGRQIKISLIGSQPGEVAVYIDGILFKTLDNTDQPPKPDQNHPFGGA